ncbi:hypothetical protein NIES4071_10810 [Calothrix sp. NIES-4071]|nr:hypothetical protein NIES4071_10810 [Calothrix sp. NIES-4071]BAZ55422.1 hypothetical protein NIES4105_10770 [Calothrix sp. NIES-4105]
MIKNEQEYNITKSWVERMGRAIAMLEQDLNKKANQPDVWQIHYDGVTSQREDLVNQVVEYEALIAHKPDEQILLEIESLDNLSDLLIKARIAFKMTHRELAIFCQRTEDEIKLFENKNYSNASYLDFTTALEVFGIKLIDGKFIAYMSDYYKEKLASIRQMETYNEAEMKAAS